MNYFSFFSLAFVALLSTTAQGQTLAQVDVKPPFMVVNCAPNEGQLGRLSLRSEKLSVTESASTLNLEATSSLSVCSIDAAEKMSLIEVNPYTGFLAQYFDVDSNSIKSRKVYIDPAKPQNRMKLLVLTHPDDNESESHEAVMQPDTGTTFSGSVTIPKSAVLDHKDLARLSAGHDVQKTIAVYQISNFTNEVDGEDLQLGDEDRGGRNIFLTFKKTRGQISIDATLLTQ